MKTSLRNFEGDLAFDLPDDLKLYAKVCTTALQGEFYTPNTNDTLNSIKTLVRKNDPEFVARLAVYAREQMYLRAVPLALVVELAKCHKGDDLVRRTTRRVIGRADELAKILIYYAKANQRKDYKKFNKLSNQLRAGIADAFYKFDEYQFAKYNRTYQIYENGGSLNNNVKLRDVLFLAHPKPYNKEQRDLFNKIAQDQLAAADTWEKRMTEGKGSKRETWETLIDERRMGYMACLRNLRNFIEQGVSTKHIEKVAEYLSNPKAVRNSKQLPFRFLAAYRALGFHKIYRQGWGLDDRLFNVPGQSADVDILADALEDAVRISIDNIPMFAQERVLIAADVSGSMQVPATGSREEEWQVQRNKRQVLVERYDIAILLSMLLLEKCEFATVGMFGNSWKPIQLPSRDILANTNRMHEREGEVGYSTNGYRVLEWALGQVDSVRTGSFDRIMVFTDCQLWDTEGRQGRMEKLWRKYKEVAPQAKLYLFNLAPYSTVPVNMVPGDVYLISGWSEKVFEVLRNIEAGHDALDEIRELDL